MKTTCISKSLNKIFWALQIVICLIKDKGIDLVIISFVIMCGKLLEFDTFSIDFLE
jgi:hypothetical protein